MRDPSAEGVERPYLSMTNIFSQLTVDRLLDDGNVPRHHLFQSGALFPTWLNLTLFHLVVSLSIQS
jgi:hypothetical protein